MLLCQCRDKFVCEPIMVGRDVITPVRESVTVVCACVCSCREGACTALLREGSMCPFMKGSFHCGQVISQLRTASNHEDERAWNAHFQPHTRLPAAPALGSVGHRHLSPSSKEKVLSCTEAWVRSCDQHAPGCPYIST